MTARPDTASVAQESPVTWIVRRMAWVVLAWQSLVTTTDADLWGHVRFGLDVLRDRTLPSVDPYSYTQDLPWTNHEWLSETLMAAAYSVGGATGLVLLKATLVIVTYVLVISVYRRALLSSSGAPGYLGEIVAVVLAILCAPLTITIRPQIWSFAAMAGLITLLQLRTPWRVVLAPLLVMAWANLHGGWIVGLGVTLIWSGGELWHERRLKWSTVGMGAGSALATLANPYGWHLWNFIATTVRLSREDIAEWLPIWSGSPITLVGWGLGAALVLLCLVRSTTRPRPEVVVILVGLAFASERVQRLVPFFLICTSMLLAPSLCRLLSRSSLAIAVDPPSLVVAKQRLNFAFMTVATFLAVYTSIPRLQCVPQRSHRPDVSAAAAMAVAELQGRLAVEFDWGEYAIWHFGPRLRVSMDGRRETIYSPTRLREWSEIAEGSQQGLTAIDRDRPEYVWMQSDRAALRQGLVERGYRIDLQTPESFVAVREDLPPLRRMEVRSSGCFPEL